MSITEMAEELETILVQIVYLLQSSLRNKTANGLSDKQIDTFRSLATLSTKQPEPTQLYDNIRSALYDHARKDSSDTEVATTFAKLGFDSEVQQAVVRKVWRTFSSALQESLLMHTFDSNTVEELKWRLDMRPAGQVEGVEGSAGTTDSTLFKFSVRSRQSGLAKQVQFEVDRTQLAELDKQLGRISSAIGAEDQGR